MDGQKLLHIVEDVFELDPGEVDEQTLLHDVPGWDSLTWMGLVARVDEEFGVTLSPDDLASSPPLGVLQQTIEKKAAQRRAA